MTNSTNQASQANVTTDVEQLTTDLALLDTESKLSMKQLAAKLNEVINAVNELKAQPASKHRKGERDYGPSSQRAMDEATAWRIMHGDLKSTKVKDIADSQGLSRGQVYSVRGGYTFNHVKADAFMLDDKGEVVAKPAAK